MEIAAAAQMAMTMKRAEHSQEVGVKMLKQSLQQDASVLQILAAATQPVAQAAVPPSGVVGSKLDISV